jgi:hypothetical protein
LKVGFGKTLLGWERIVEWPLVTRLLGEGLVGVIGVALPILDPIIGIAIAIAILFIVKNAAVSVWTRLIDGIEPGILAEIEHAPTHVAGVRDVRDVRARCGFALPAGSSRSTVRSPDDLAPKFIVGGFKNRQIRKQNNILTASF